MAGPRAHDDFGTPQDRKNKEAADKRDKAEKERKTMDALGKAFGLKGQAERQMETPQNEQAFRDKEAQAKAETSIPPGLNPLKYGPNPTPSYDATPENLTKVLGGALTGVLAPGVGIGLGPIVSDALGLGFDNPTGPVPGHDYDKGAPGQEDGGGPGGEAQDDRFNQPVVPVKPPKPPTETPIQDPWLYPEDPDFAAGVDEDGLTDEERRRRGSASLVVLGQGGLAI